MAGITNTKAAYGWLAIALHWISAVGVIWLYVLGEDIEHAFHDKLPRDEIIALIQFHASVGIAFFAFLAARVISSLTQVRPAPLSPQRYLDLLALFVQRLWLLMIAMQIVTGPLIIWSNGSPLPVFGLFSIPSPLPKIEWLHEGAEQVHAIAPNLFWPLLVLHVGGALKHLAMDRDRTLARMLWVRG